ncbi:hypothetical protein R6242_21330 [Iodobacter sp. CM08]|uniref:hypothetical protein n=1 Tax=Iodobacter sp. CM08 TaxID=3085902 RepID=UPI002980A370|nr:hypothetical protein [Iodobacter sp. CM08]MDW5419119.1 hypothetical protein [Iodobacter sp. CM08]
MGINTWTNQAGNLMAIADSAEAACELWQSDLQEALDNGRMSLDDLDGALPQYVPARADRITSDARSYAMDGNAPGIEEVMAAVDAGCLFEYN